MTARLMMPVHDVDLAPENSRGKNLEFSDGVINVRAAVTRSQPIGARNAKV
jgi:hypothetical protein